MWVALEDADEENGALVVMPGAHKANWVDRFEFVEALRLEAPIPPSGAGIWSSYQRQIKERAEQAGFKEESLPAKKGTW